MISGLVAERLAWLDDFDTRAAWQREAYCMEATFGSVGDEYALFSSVSGVLAWVSLCFVAVGTFLAHDGYPGHKLLGRVGEVMGAVIYVLDASVAQHDFATKRLECTLSGRDCEPVDDNVLRAFFGVLAEPVKTAVSPGTLLPPLVAWAIGWGAARMTKRRRPPADGLEN